MAKYSKFNIVYQLQKWMDSVAGQTFMNYAYSWGASVVILGTLFKLTHLPYANVIMFIGMGTEVFVFFISAFDRPFDKTQEGRDLATDTQLAAIANGMESVSLINGGVSGTIAEGNTGTIVIGGGSPASAISNESIDTDGGTLIIGQSIVPSAPSTAEGYIPETGEESSSTSGANSTVIMGNTIGAPAPAVTAETAKAMEEATTTYVERLNELNELLTKIGDLNKRLTIDSEEMETLNRTLTGIARVYEMQLKSASKQITTQDEINAQTGKMAERIAELNSCYTRMIEAMRVNVPGAQ